MANSCSDCKYQKIIGAPFPSLPKLPPMCSHAGNGADGTPKPMRACFWERSKGACGPDGLWWEADS